MDYNVLVKSPNIHFIDSRKSSPSGIESHVELVRDGDRSLKHINILHTPHIFPTLRRSARLAAKKARKKALEEIAGRYSRAIPNTVASRSPPTTTF